MSINLLSLVLVSAAFSMLACKNRDRNSNGSSLLETPNKNQDLKSLWSLADTRSTSARFSSDGKQLVIVKHVDLRTTGLTLLDLSTGSSKSILETDRVRSGTGISTNGKFFALASWSSSLSKGSDIAIYDASTGESIKNIHVSGWPNLILPSDDGKTIMLADHPEYAKGFVKVIQIETEKELAVLKVDFVPNYIRYLSNGEALVSGRVDNGVEEINRFDVANGKVGFKFQTESLSSTADIDFAPNGSALVLNRDENLRLINTENGKKIAELNRNEEGFIRGVVAVTDDGKLAAVPVRTLSKLNKNLDPPPRLEVWNFNTGKKLSFVSGKDNYDLGFLTFSRNGGLLAVGWGTSISIYSTGF